MLTMNKIYLTSKFSVTYTRQTNLNIVEHLIVKELGIYILQELFRGFKERNSKCERVKLSFARWLKSNH